MNLSTPTKHRQPSPTTSTSYLLTPKEKPFRYYEHIIGIPPLFLPLPALLKIAALLRYNAYHTIHSFKVYISVVFSIVTDLCNHHHSQF